MLIHIIFTISNRTIIASNVIPVEDGGTDLTGLCAHGKGEKNLNLLHLLRAQLANEPLKCMEFVQIMCECVCV